MRSHDWGNSGLDEESSGNRKHKPRTNSYHAWNQMLKRHDNIEKLREGLSVTVKYASVILGLVAIMSIPSAKNKPTGGNNRPVEASEKIPTTSPEKVAAILSTTNLVK